MIKRWLITDTHFNHENMRNGKLSTVRPWDYQQQIIDNWNRLVSPCDIVYHLGDVIFARRDELREILSELKGTKILIRGNHDKIDIGNSKRKIAPVPDFYIDSGFADVVESLLVRHFVLLSHAPMELSSDIKFNIHGHFHDNDHHSLEPWYKDMYEKDSRYRLLSIEREGYKPVLLEEFIGRG